VIFIAAPIQSGAASEAVRMNSPAKAGAAAHDPNRTMCVTPEANVRSSGRTTAIT